MSDNRQPPRNAPHRASIRGKGREILLGSGLAESSRQDGHQPGIDLPGEENLRDYSPEELVEILELPPSGAGDAASPYPPAPPRIPEPFLSADFPADHHTSEAYHSESQANTLVDDAAMKHLWSVIEALRSELLVSLKDDRDTVELYWQDLAEAGTLLLDSRANYGRARDMVFRVQTDLARRTELRAAVRRYRPWLLGYLVLWTAVWVVLVALESPIKDWGSEQDVMLLVAAYLPILYGLLGGVADSFMRLTRSMGAQQDFDSLDVPSYLLAPIGGAVMGLFLFLLASLANQDLLDGLGTTLEKAAVWTLAFVAGLNYDAITRRLGGLIRPTTRNNSRSS